MKKKIVIIATIITLSIVLVLWISGIIPKQIAKVYSNNYLKNNFPKMQFEYENIEWSSAYGEYLISFKDDKNETYTFCIGPKYFPTSIGQGIFELEQKYKDATEEYIKYVPNNEEVNRDMDKVSIKVLENTISREKLSIMITDNNESKFGYTHAFRIQKKINGEWEKSLEESIHPISNPDMYFFGVLTGFNENNQVIMELDFKRYMNTTLDDGIYRIVKPAYISGYAIVEFYSDEFEIK